MSTLQLLEKAAASLRGEEQRSLLKYLTSLLDNPPRPALAATPSVPASATSPLHPALLPMVGILPLAAEPDQLHDYRLLKHA